MKKLLLIQILLLFITQYLDAQNQYYYYNGEKVPLKINREKINIIFHESFDPASFAKNSIKDIFQIENKNGYKIASIGFSKKLDSLILDQEVQALKQNSSVISIAYYYENYEGSSIGSSNIFYVKLKNGEDQNVLRQLAEKLRVEVIGQNMFMPLWFKLQISNDPLKRSGVELSNVFYESGLFSDIDPAFIFNFNSTCTNDPNFNQLWGLNNSANGAIDVNACAAWNITQGAGINVAVIDQGIFRTHNDLNANMSALSFNTATGTVPSVFVAGNNHGTHVAGTIAAVKDNNLQVVGLAPSSRLIGISNTLNVSPTISEQLANGMNWAWQNGADVISNSWGDQGGAFYNNLHTALLENAINNALTNGRGGRGSVVVFAAGNQSPSPIDYPANFTGAILCVGAINNTGIRSAFSAFGTTLDVVAPGQNIISTLPNQTIGSMDGTSMATPHVSALAALVLSVNRNLTNLQVNNIIENTSQKVGGYTYSTTTNRPNGTWNNQMGYGLIDAYAAVANAQPKILGPAQFCPAATFSISPAAGAVTWSVSPANALTFTQGALSTTFTRSGSFTGLATITATVTGAQTYTLSKSVIVNGTINFTWNGPGPYGQLDVSVTGGSAPFKFYRGTTLIYTSSFSSATIPFGCNGGILKVEATTPCGIVSKEAIVSSGCPKMMTVYPNPTSSIINIKLSPGDDALRISSQKESWINEKGLRLQVYDQSNILMISKVVGSFGTEVLMDVSSLKPGIYFLQISGSDFNEIHKLQIK